jgi:uncharacterized protein (DUF2062 family)
MRVKRFKRFIIRRVLHANDSPHRVALGAAIGLFIAWTPAVGLHMLMVLALTTLLRANKLVALAFVWVCNPFTYVPLFYSSYLLGKIVLKPSHDTELAYVQMSQVLDSLRPSSGYVRLFHQEFWQNLFHLLWIRVPELWVGSLLAGFLIAFLAYMVTYRTILSYRKTRSK